MSAALLREAEVSPAPPCQYSSGMGWDGMEVLCNVNHRNWIQSIDCIDSIQTGSKMKLMFRDEHITSGGYGSYWSKRYNIKSPCVSITMYKEFWFLCRPWLQRLACVVYKESISLWIQATPIVLDCIYILSSPPWEHSVLLSTPMPTI